MEIAYMKIVSHETELQQKKAISMKNCEEIRKDPYSAHGHRPELWRTLSEMKKGDSLIIYNLPAIADSFMQLIEVLKEMHSREIHLVSISEKINTAFDQHTSFFLAAEILADFQRKTISQNTKAGLSKARKKGRKVGRPPISSQKVKKALEMYKSKQFTFEEIKKQTDIGKTTIYRYLQKQ